MSFALGNPIVYSDPSGQLACDGENNINRCQGVTSKDLSNLVKFDYGWALKGKWSKHNIDKLLNYASNFATNVFNVTGKNGTTWIRNHLGNATLWTGGITDWILANIRKNGTEGMVPTYSDVLLSSSGFSEHNFIHEMGHVFDNNVKNGLLPATFSGGGPADAMVAAIGGHPELNFPRFIADYGWYVKYVAETDPWPQIHYGNNGVADDFAETFAYTLNGGFVPASRQLWMTSFLNLLP